MWNSNNNGRPSYVISKHHIRRILIWLSIAVLDLRKMKKKTKKKKYEAIYFLIFQLIVLTCEVTTTNINCFEIHSICMCVSFVFISFLYLAANIFIYFLFLFFAFVSHNFVSSCFYVCLPFNFVVVIVTFCA